MLGLEQSRADEDGHDQRHRSYDKRNIDGHCWHWRQRKIGDVIHGTDDLVGRLTGQASGSDADATPLEITDCTTF